MRAILNPLSQSSDCASGLASPLLLRGGEPDAESDGTVRWFLNAGWLLIIARRLNDAWSGRTDGTHQS